MYFLGLMQDKVKLFLVLDVVIYYICLPVTPDRCSCTQQSLVNFTHIGIIFSVRQGETNKQLNSTK